MILGVKLWEELQQKYRLALVLIKNKQDKAHAKRYCISTAEGIIVSEIQISISAIKDYTDKAHAKL